MHLDWFCDTQSYCCSMPHQVSPLVDGAKVAGKQCCKGEILMAYTHTRRCCLLSQLFCNARSLTWPDLTAALSLCKEAASSGKHRCNTLEEDAATDRTF